MLKRAPGIAVAAFLLATGCSSPSADQPDIDGFKMDLVVGKRVYLVEVASTEESRERGLMGREHLKEGAGMLFVFGEDGKHCFWMRNTPIPLSIAFIDSHGRIAGTADMKPKSEKLHCPKRAVRYALEVPRGDFDRNGIKTGDQVVGLP